jgi:rubredoxin
MTPDTTLPFEGTSETGLMRTGTTPLPAVTEDTVTMHVVPAPAEDVTPERPFPRYPIGDALISSLPGFDILPCGHCGAVFDSATPAVLTAVRPLMEMRSLAYDAGWGYDLSLIWTCPACREDPLAAYDRAAARADASAEHEHGSILAWTDGKFEDAMNARGAQFTCRWSYDERADEAAAEGQAAA